MQMPQRVAMSLFALICAGFLGLAEPPAQAPKQKAPDEFTRLGRERADFGDKPNAGDWGYFVPGAMGGTHILFPVGRSDRRYYWTEEQLRLCCESKHGNKITLDWMITLDSAKTPYPFPKGGTLWKYVCHGLRPHGRISKAARLALQAREALAAYQPADSVNVSPSCWFVKVDGTDCGYEGFDNGGGNTLPITRVPYPITKEEKKAILAARAKKPVAPRSR
jgi:hypothetical protein